ncbi:LytR C-terminal domain-containing protein [Sanguibacter sp. A247]|uniref:LytR C-terminal domain-containing protein n=1 Tax=unclassified Sanguibacter TaxID=2645534 RepID=UPI003FD820A1
MSGYPYPNDEFDIELDDSHALGIHHARRSTWSKIWPFLVVVLVCAALAVALVTWFTSQGRVKNNAAPPSTSTTAAATTAPTTTVEPSEEPSTETTTEPADDETTTEPDEDPTTEEPAAPELTRSTAIRVLNATRTQGLAASRVSTLKQAGWTNVVGENFPSSSNAPSSTSVWYRSADLADEAKQVAADLGITTVTLVEELRGDMSVVLVG